ncbi:MAG: DNA-processing protein DprA [Thermomicrobiales bacterium]
MIFGVGESELLNRSPGLAIVGSRDIGEEQVKLAKVIGRRFAQAGYLIISGGARGVIAGGCLAPWTMKRQRWVFCMATRSGSRSDGMLVSGLKRNSFCLVSHVHPATGFSFGNAMARNRYIHALADATVVIATSAGTGGTWQGRSTI